MGFDAGEFFKDIYGWTYHVEATNGRVVVWANEFRFIEFSPEEAGKLMTAIQVALFVIDPEKVPS